jgi:hypothetical protein
MARISKGLSVYEIQNPLHIRLNFPTEQWTDKSASAYLIRIFDEATENVLHIVTSAGDHFGIDVRRLLEVLSNRWEPYFSYTRLASVAVTTALPGAFLIFIRDHPESWAARHQTKIANALHVLALVSVANQRLSVQDLLVAGLVMVGFEALQVGNVGKARRVEAKDGPKAFETLLNRTHGIVAKSDFGGSPVSRRRCVTDAGLGDAASTAMAKDAGSALLPRRHSVKSQSGSATSTKRSADAENARLEKELTRARQDLVVARTSEKTKELEVKRVKKELQNARKTLDDNFAEYSTLRDEMKNMKQSLGSDHQAVVYRKDIELFALRKSNDQKETYIKERETKLEDIYRQQKSTLELKDAQVRNLKDRIAFLERQSSPRIMSEIKMDSATDSETQDALQVRLLRVKGRSSTEIEDALEAKETEIATLRIDLAKAMSACEALNRTQDELQRAWDSVFEIQKMLNDERQRHVQTQNKLQEAANHLEEEARSRPSKSSPTVLPTIQEQDKNELESMFNAAQEDNLRLYTVVEALEKRLRDANARLFTSEQEAEAVAEQLRLEKAINEDMETARPSLVHRVHFQRMEGQLKEIRDSLVEKDTQISTLKKTVSEKDAKLADLEKAEETAASSHAKLHEENEQLKKDVKSLEATKEQLMLDHERLAQHRSRPQYRNSSAEHTSARSSATLFTDAQTAQPITSDEPLPARPVSVATTPVHTPTTSIQNTPERLTRNDPQRHSMINNELPPAELRGARRKSLTLKGLMKKFVRKDDEEPFPNVSIPTTEKQERPKTALMPKDRNLLVRPQTATAAPTKASKDDTKTRSVPAPPMKHKKTKSEVAPKTKIQAAELDSDTPDVPRYYAAHPDGRPMTAAPTTGKLMKDTDMSKVEARAAGTKGVDGGRPMTAVPSKGAGAEGARPMTAAPATGTPGRGVGDVKVKAREDGEGSAAKEKKERPRSIGAWAAS